MLFFGIHTYIPFIILQLSLQWRINEQLIHWVHADDLTHTLGGGGNPQQNMDHCQTITVTVQRKTGGR